MVVRISIFLCFAALVGLYVYNPTGARTLVGSSSTAIAETFSKFIYKKRLELSSGRLVSKDELVELLPVKKSVYWWLQNGSQISADLSKHRLIKSATVGSCHDWVIFSWGCFKVQISEVQPTFLSQVDNKTWLIGDEGTFIAPFEPHEVPDAMRKLKRKFPDLVVVYGVQRRELSPDGLRAQFRYLAKSVGEVRSAVEFPIEKVELMNVADFYITFVDSSLRARFEGTLDGNWSKIERQAKRLSKVLAKIDGKLQQVREVDLGFERLAVVKLREKLNN